MREGTSALVPARIKATPEDFLVTEITSLAPGGSGPYRLYRLTKRGWRTDDLLAHIAGRRRLARSLFAYGGKKDRRAITAQHVTIRSRRDHSLAEDTFELRSLGFTAEPMSPAHLLGNRFDLVLRRVGEADLETIALNAASALRTGVPNYFDDQRFASCRRATGFAAERMLHGAWEEALQLLLATPVPGDPPTTKRHKRHLRASWRDWDSCLRAARTGAERAAFAVLLARPGAFREALTRLPREEVSMSLAALQSHLWNQALARLIADSCGDTVAVPGRMGPYLFHRELPPEMRPWLSALVVAMPAPRGRQADPAAEAACAAALREAGIEPHELALRGLRAAYLRPHPRPAVVFPAGLELGPREADTLHPGACAVRVGFSLSPGAYATMVVKRLLLAGKPPAPGSNPAGGRCV